jgi:lipoprotein-anchoring transpeptidase ErfK/SrfK
MSSLPPSRASAVCAALVAACALATGAAGAPQTRGYTLTETAVAHWAPVLRGVAARLGPQAHAPVVARLSAVTSEWTQNVVLVVRGVVVRPGETWYEVRLPVLPNNSTGWVPRSALGNLYAVHTHLYVDRKRFSLRLERDGRTIFAARVGVGRPKWPTPAGEFYVRDELTAVKDPFYGPVAFGTSARSPVLTDWPGGGFIGIHGTDEPQLLPGAVSHGCIRLPNREIVRLARLLVIGTPITIT